MTNKGSADKGSASKGSASMNDADKAEDRAEAAETTGQARFGRLPRRIRLEDMVQEVPATVPDPAKDTYNPDEWVIRNAPL